MQATQSTTTRVAGESAHDNVVPFVDPKLLGDAPTDLQDARVSGPDSPEWRALLSRPMTFLLPKSRNRDARQDEWKNATAPFHAWLTGGRDGALTMHVERPAKGYFPIVFGGAAKAEGYTARKQDGMKTVYVIGLDVDSGDSYDAALDRADALGLACIGYTSFRAGTTTTKVKRDTILNKRGLAP